LLPAMPPHFRNGHTVHADLPQGIPDRVQTGRLDDRFEFLHGLSSPLRGRSWYPGRSLVTRPSHYSDVGAGWKDLEKSCRKELFEKSCQGKLESSSSEQSRKFRQKTTTPLPRVRVWGCLRLHNRPQRRTLLQVEAFHPTVGCLPSSLLRLHGFHRRGGWGPRRALRHAQDRKSVV